MAIEFVNAAVGGAANKPANKPANKANRANKVNEPANRLEEALARIESLEARMLVLEARPSGRVVVTNIERPPDKSDLDNVRKAYMRDLMRRKRAAAKDA